MKLMNLMNLFYKLPYELVIHIYEYNPEHREQMKRVFKDIRNVQYCDVCNKHVMKKSYGFRCYENDYIACCSSECRQLGLALLL